MNRPIGGFVAVLAMLTITGCGPKGQADPGMGGPADVGVIIARTGPVTLTEDLSGRISAFLISEVRPQVGGVVKARLFQEGAYVRAGQPLYRIDPATYQAAYDQRPGRGPGPGHPPPINAAKLQGRPLQGNWWRSTRSAARTMDDAQSAAQQAAAKRGPPQRAALLQQASDQSETTPASPRRSPAALASPRSTPGAPGPPPASPIPWATVAETSKRSMWMWTPVHGRPTQAEAKPWPAAIFKPPPPPRQ